MSWQDALDDAKTGLALLEQARATLNAMGNAAAADVARYLRMGDAGVELDEDAIRATLDRPYTLVPINEHEAWLIHWKGVRMPVLGWVVKHEPAFILARVTRSMDMIAPLPPFVKDELGWKEPAHRASLNAARTSVEVEAGDAGAFKARYGKFLAGKDSEHSFKVRGGEAWIKLVMNLLRDGIMPYRPQPVDAAHWNPEAPTDVVLRDYQTPMVGEFLESGSILLNLPPGAGKTFIVLSILQRFAGRALVLIDSTPGVEHWRYMLGLHAPGARCDVTVSTYQGARKWLEQAWDLIIYDEAQRVPANTFSKAAFARTLYRIGATGTAWREDNRQHMIVALCGKPVTIPWAELIRAGVLRRPRILVDIVKSDADKTALTKALVAGRKGKTLVFCDWLKEGSALAEALDAPFVSGTTSHKLDAIREAEVCVVSRVADRAIDLPDLRLVVEVGFMGKSREQEGQRLGRLLHGEFHGEYHVLFTEDEYARYRARLFGIEAELAGEVEIEIVQHGGASRDSATGRSVRVHGKPARTGRPSVVSGVEKQPQDEIAATMALPPVAAKLSRAAGEVGARTAPYFRKMFRLCYSAAFSAEEVADGLGIMDAATVSRMRSACKALLRVGLFTLVEREGEPDRYRVSQDEIGRLKALAGAVR